MKGLLLFTLMITSAFVIVTTGSIVEVTFVILWCAALVSVDVNASWHRTQAAYWRERYLESVHKG